MHVRVWCVLRTQLRSTPSATCSIMPSTSLTLAQATSLRCLSSLFPACASTSLATNTLGTKRAGARTSGAGGAEHTWATGEPSNPLSPFQALPSLFLKLLPSLLPLPRVFSQQTISKGSGPRTVLSTCREGTRPSPRDWSLAWASQ